LKVKKYLQTADLAQAVGVSTQTVRKYEQWGFLPGVERLPNGYRRYTPAHLQALLTSRTLIAGYGWPQALEIMRHLHQKQPDAALALVDARHAELHHSRQEVAKTLAALQTVVAGLASGDSGRNLAGDKQLLQVGEAARQVGVKVSALHFWEAQGLLRPGRLEESGYRVYDAVEMRRLQVVALLRKAGYSFPLIAGVLAELDTGTVERALAAVETRLANLSAASQRCTAATAALWKYLAEA
jgi:DNA-binding transcriptional MerR regulator